MVVVGCANRLSLDDVVVGRSRVREHSEPAVPCLADVARRQSGRYLSCQISCTNVA